MTAKPGLPARLGSVAGPSRRLITIALIAALLPLAAASAAADDGPTYEVRPGDTLDGIAAITGVAIDDLVALNDLPDPDVIYVGQVLLITGRATPEPVPTPTTYEVQPGDTLTGISARTGVSIDRLDELNGFTDPDRLLVGQMLLLPVGVEPPGAGLVEARQLMVGAASPEATSPPAPSATVTVPATGTPTATPSATRTPAPVPTATATRSPSRSLSAGPATSGPVPVISGAGPAVRWVGSPNFWPGRPAGEPIALVIHTAAGTMAGMDRWFANPASDASAHFGIGRDGRISQYVMLGDRAWANGNLETGNLWPGPPDVNPNDLTVSIEAEDMGDWVNQVTEAQFQATLAIGRLVLSRYPKIRYLVTHRSIAPETRPNDPGPGWLDSGRFAALARALGLIAVP